MKSSVIKFIIIYFLFVIVFILQKPIFMLLYHNLYADASISDYLAVIYNGLPLDFSLSGYLTIIPGLLLIIAQWSKSKILKKIEKCYYCIIAILISIVFCLDIALYEYWGVKLDATPLFYFFSSPMAAIASVSTWYVIARFIAIIFVAIILYLAFYLVIIKRNTEFSRKPIGVTIIIFLLTGLLFIPIRGGFTVSTMNLSRVYFSQDQLLNHAAINPLFSLMYSATHQDNFGEQFRFHSQERADEIFSTMIETEESDSIPQILLTKRPDIYLIIFESFSVHLMPSFNGITPPIAVNLDSIAQEGILFTNFFANGYRTDRAIPAILSAYPSQPTTSIMKDVTKTDKLPSIPRTLKDAGYHLTYYYGGDINFTNLGAYLVSSGFDEIISDKDFPIGERLSKWGVHDHLVFERLNRDINTSQHKTPTLRVIQTSSSHEPFEVPFNSIHTDKRANAFAYADSCLGDFVRKLKLSGKWDNSLLIITPDHYGAYPQLDNPVDRHRIPLIFAGGAVSQPMKIDVTASQIDIAATLMYQLGLPSSQFKFSKNIFNNRSPHFAYFADPSQIGIVCDNNEVVYNCNAEQIIHSKGESIDSLQTLGTAFLQKLYDDLDKR